MTHWSSVLRFSELRSQGQELLPLLRCTDIMRWTDRTQTHWLVHLSDVYPVWDNQPTGHLLHLPLRLRGNQPAKLTTAFLSGTLVTPKPQWHYIHRHAHTDSSGCKWERLYVARQPIKLQQSGATLLLLMMMVTHLFLQTELWFRDLKTEAGWRVEV